MRNLVVFIIFLVSIGLIFWRAWIGVLVLAMWSYLNPHTYTWGFMFSFPAFQVLFLAAFASFLISKDKQPLPSDWRVKAFYLLWFFFFLTTLNAKLPFLAWPRFLDVSKIYLPFILTLILINTRKKLFYLIATIATSFALIGVKGGIWAVKSGFSHRVYGPPKTQFFENNAFAIALLITIPLLILCLREVNNKLVKVAIIVAIPLVWSAALSSWSRGGLLTSVVLGMVLLWHSKRKYLVFPLAFAGILFISGALPQEWYQRMGTIENYEEDTSAQSRLKNWRDGYLFALKNPLLGAGFEGWRKVTHSDWHSSYIEILGEHGFIAFGLWMSLLWGSILALTRLAAIGRRHRRELPWILNYATMLRASLLAYATGTIFLGLSYWDIFYHIVFISVLAKKFAFEEIENLKATSVMRTENTSLNTIGPAPGMSTIPRRM